MKQVYGACTDTCIVFCIGACKAMGPLVLVFCIMIWNAGFLTKKKSKFHVGLKIASPAAHFKASCIHGAWISTKSLTLEELKQEYCGLLVAKYFGCWCSGSLHQQVVGNHMYDHGPFSTSIKDFFKHALRYQFENCCIHSAGGIKCRAVRSWDRGTKET